MEPDPVPMERTLSSRLDNLMAHGRFGGSSADQKRGTFCPDVKTFDVGPPSLDSGPSPDKIVEKKVENKVEKDANKKSSSNQSNRPTLGQMLRTMVDLGGRGGRELLSPLSPSIEAVISDIVSHEASKEPLTEERRSQEPTPVLFCDSVNPQADSPDSSSSIGPDAAESKTSLDVRKRQSDPARPPISPGADALKANDAKPDLKREQKSELKTEPKPEIRPETKPETKPEVKPEPRFEAPKPKPPSTSSQDAGADKAVSPRQSSRREESASHHSSDPPSSDHKSADSRHKTSKSDSRDSKPDSRDGHHKSSSSKADSRDERRDSRNGDRGGGKSDRREDAKSDRRDEIKPDRRDETKSDRREETKPDRRDETKSDRRDEKSDRRDDKDRRQERDRREQERRGERSDRRDGSSERRGDDKAEDSVRSAERKEDKAARRDERREEKSERVRSPRRDEKPDRREEKRDDKADRHERDKSERSSERRESRQAEAKPERRETRSETRGSTIEPKPRAESTEQFRGRGKPSYAPPKTAPPPKSSTSKPTPASTAVAPPTIVQGLIPFRPVVETSTWVACDKCSKWRKVREAVNQDAAWFCTMNLDPLHNDCSAPEEVQQEGEITTVPPPDEDVQKNNDSDMKNNDSDIATDNRKVPPAADAKDSKTAPRRETARPDKHKRSRSLEPEPPADRAKRGRSTDSPIDDSKLRPKQSRDAPKKVVAPKSDPDPGASSSSSSSSDSDSAPSSPAGASSSSSESDSDDDVILRPGKRLAPKESVPDKKRLRNATPTSDKPSAPAAATPSGVAPAASGSTPRSRPRIKNVVSGSAVSSAGGPAHKRSRVSTSTSKSGGSPAAAASGGEGSGSRSSHKDSSSRSSGSSSKPEVARDEKPRSEPAAAAASDKSSRGSSSSTSKQKKENFMSSASDLWNEAKILKQEASRLNNAGRKEEGAEMFLRAGLKFLEWAAGEIPQESGPNARQTISNYLGVNAIFQFVIRHSKEKLHVAVSHLCIATVLHRLYSLRRDSVYRMMYDLDKGAQSTTAQAPSPSSCASAESLDRASPAGPGGPGSNPVAAATAKTQAQFLSECRQIFSCLDHWRDGCSMANALGLELPLDCSTAPAQMLVHVRRILSPTLPQAET